MFATYMVYIAIQTHEYAGEENVFSSVSRDAAIPWDWY